MDKVEARVLPALSSIFETDKVHRCACGSTAFFDWGVKLLHREVVPTAPSTTRYANFAGELNVNICVECHRPVAIWNGDLYDATEFISKDEVARLLEFGATRQHVTPIRAMDP